MKKKVNGKRLLIMTRLDVLRWDYAFVHPGPCSLRYFLQTTALRVDHRVVVRVRAYGLGICLCDK